MHRPLSAEQCSRFEQDGFLVLENFVSREQCRALLERAQQLLEQFACSTEAAALNSVFSTQNQDRDEYFLESGEAIRFFLEEEACDAQGQRARPLEQSINKIGHALHELDPVFAEFSTQTAIRQLLADLAQHGLGPQRPQLLQSMYIYKQPGIGGEVGLHQDATFLYTEPQSVLGLWFALEDATLENGCLQALAGGHRIAMKQRYKRDGSGGTCFEQFDASPFPDQELSCLEVPAGTLILLHGLLPHYSAANRSARSRQAYTLHCIDANAHYPQDNWLQRRWPAPELSLKPQA